MGAYKKAFTFIEVLRNQRFDEYQSLVSLSRDIINKSSKNKRDIIRDTPNKFLLSEAECMLLKAEYKDISIDAFVTALKERLERGLQAGALDRKGYIRD